jgi:hypothetical protein
MLTSKLHILNGSVSHRTSLALTMLTGRIIDPSSYLADFELLYSRGEVETFEAPVLLDAHRQKRFAARTVYLSDRHLRDVDRIIEAWQHVDAKRLTRSAVLRRAIDYLRDAVEADPAMCTLEND